MGHPAPKAHKPPKIKIKIAGSRAAVCRRLRPVPRDAEQKQRFVQLGSGPVRSSGPPRYHQSVIPVCLAKTRRAFLKNQQV